MGISESFADNLIEPPIVQVELTLDQIDPSVAQQVRAEIDEEALARYAAAYLAGQPMPPVEVYRGGDRNFLADGGHRYHARRQSGAVTIDCRLRICQDETEALALAFRHAAGANSEHGLPRTIADKRAAISAVLVRPEFITASDRTVAKLCRVGHVLVRQVREELTRDGHLTGQASSAHRWYKASANLRGESGSDGIGLLNFASTSTNQREIAELAIAGSDSSIAPWPNESGQSLDQPMVQDALNRTVPAGLVAAFTTGRDFFRRLRETIRTLVASAEMAAEEPWGDAIRMGNIRAGAALLTEHAEAAEPYVVCPLVEADGRHQQIGRCRLCETRSWLTNPRFRELSAELRQLCESHQPSIHLTELGKVTT